MNNELSRWNPLRELEDFQNRILNAFNSGAGRHRRGQESSLPLAEWMPLVDIAEDDSEYVITAELPEVKKEDVKVTVENGVLAITGDRKFERAQNTKKYHRIERSYGSFARVFALPDHGDVGNVHAEFKEGLLKVRVAKRESARPKQIAVTVS